MTQSANVFKVSRRYTSQILDDATGLYYYNARYYDPALGRFIEPDQGIPDFANPQSYNRYAYWLNDPLRITDPDGHGYWSDVGGVFEGYYDAGASVVTGTATMIAHPINTAEGLASAAEHPKATAQTIANGVATTWNSGPRGQGQIVGGVLIAVGTALAPAAEASNVSKVGDVSNAASKTEGAAGAASKANPGGLTANQARKIQDFANKHDTPVHVVGSRAAGTAHEGSDIDYNWRHFKNTPSR